MKFSPDGYARVTDQTTPHGAIVAWWTREPEDPQWDVWLRQTPLGQYQQSTFWMRAKRAQGWNPIRLVVTVDGAIAGGFQVLWRSMRFGRLAYVSKGPVVLPEFTWLSDFLLDMMRAISRTERLRMLFVQPPDFDRHLAARLQPAGFLRELRPRFITATWIADVSGGIAAIEKGMNRSTRQNVRQAERSGVVVREGGRDDIDVVFQMMQATCSRQEVSPEPSCVEDLRALWDAAAPDRAVRVTLAQVRGEPVAGLISLVFGDTVTFWRKGWSGRESRLHPNELLMYEALKWSHTAGYHFCDYAALDRSIAMAMIDGQALTMEHKRSRHLFNIRLGGFVRLVPEARVYLPGRPTRALYRLACASQMALSSINFKGRDRSMAAVESHAR